MVVLAGTIAAEPVVRQMPAGEEVPGLPTAERSIRATDRCDPISPSAGAYERTDDSADEQSDRSEPKDPVIALQVAAELDGWIGEKLERDPTHHASYDGPQDRTHDRPSTAVPN